MAETTNNTNNKNPKEESPSSERILFQPSASGRHLDEDHALFRRPTHPDSNLMGPILRRKRVVSMPLGAGGDFFVSNDMGGPHRQHFTHFEHITPAAATGGTLETIPASSRAKQASHPPLTSSPRRVRQDSGAAQFFKGVVRRKQVSLDLLGPNDFFVIPTEEEEEQAALVTPQKIKEEEELVVGEDEEKKAQEAKPKKLFAPLRFKPRMKLVSGGSGGGGHGGGHGATAMLPPVDEEVVQAVTSLGKSNQELEQKLVSLQKEMADSKANSSLVQAGDSLLESHRQSVQQHEQVLASKFNVQMSGDVGDEAATTTEDGKDSNLAKKEVSQDEDDDSNIIRATKGDKIKAAICFLLMAALTTVVATWETHLDEDSFIYGPVGLACVTDCQGEEETRDFFQGHGHFESGEVIDLIMHLDPYPEAAHAIVEVVGADTGTVKATVQFGPAEEDERITQEETITCDFDHLDEQHVINLVSDIEGAHLSFTLSAHVKKPLADHSELIAALIMIAVYALILIEVIHRTLVAIIGSMVALMFFFIMSGGYTESIAQIMLHLEWSTLGLLFGMMLIVGELSHTGVFEWCAVRLLMASKGSFNRLIVLLCALTAVASAFLDNVTTMLLVAPVTIDMCNILEVDPRPYLIGEVILSNIGGTATLIGDPPNIIIGSSFDEIGFVDFIVNVLPCIFIFCLPVSLALVCWIYRYYLTSTEMRVLDTAKLKKTYPIYDEPRLMIAGTVTGFVILMFFLHPVHHKDTAWIALMGAFVTIAFTNPHDVQDALRNHVEWDTLLFFAGLFVLVEVCAAMGLLDMIGDALASYIEDQPEDKQLSTAITLILWVSAITSAFLDNIPYTATMIPVIQILADKLPDTLPITTLAWALSFGACLGGNGTLLGASANIVTAGISTNKGFEITFLNFFYPGMLSMIVTVAIANIYMLVVYAWI